MQTDDEFTDKPINKAIMKIKRHADIKRRLSQIERLEVMK